MLAHTDDTLVTQRKEHPDQPGHKWPTSSSTRPGLMLKMLHLLDVRDGMTVLEIGTGTGYNAALLSERLGAQNVTSMDIDSELTSTARIRLGDAGYRPTLATCDGALGYPGRASYDRLSCGSPSPTMAPPAAPWCPAPRDSCPPGPT
jgi:protein-L-isoaspartate(D-aspartate) O-methyltransferase